MRRKVVCFDLDDTLYKEVCFLFSGYRKISETIEKRTGEKSVFEKMCHLRRDGKNVFEEIEKEYEGVINKAEMLIIYREHMPTIALEEGVAKLLTTLKERGCVLGLITDGRSLSQKNKIKALGLEQWFHEENIVISEEFGSEKPNERNYLYFEDRYPGCRYYYVGDNPKKDFIAPNRLGWETYGVRDMFGKNIHSSDYEKVDDCEKPKYVVDRIQCLEYKIAPPLENEYIVPIMEDIQRDETQTGTGVIIGEYLVTAAHVFYKGDYQSLHYKFDNEDFSLVLKDAYYDGHSVGSERNDLLVFKVSHHGSPFTLNDGVIDYKERFQSRAYHYDDKLRVDLFDGISILREPTESKMCLLIKTQYGIQYRPGNSGCPVFHNNVVYGTLWRGHKSSDVRNGNYRYLIMDSRYIKQIIENKRGLKIDS